MRAQPGSHNEQGSRKPMFAASLAIHVLLLGVFPFLLASFRSTRPPEELEVVFYPRSAERPELPPPPPPEPVEPEIADVAPPEPAPQPAPEVEPVPRMAKLPASRTPRRQPEVAPLPPRLRPEVGANVFEQARSEPEVAQPSVRRTRSAGFDTAPSPAPARTGSSLRAGARVGGFEVDPAPAEAPTGRERAVTTASFGGEPAPPTTRRATTRTGGTVKTAGFGGETAGAVPRSGAGVKTGNVTTGGFGDTVAAAEPRRRRQRPKQNPDTPVEILSKPKPVYTAEARRLKIEGEVVLEVVFVASGEMRVLRVVNGLGHGLDEAAVEAARKIEFKPARRNGQPVDHTARLRIVFQLA